MIILIRLLKRLSLPLIKLEQTIIFYSQSRLIKSITLTCLIQKETNNSGTAGQI